MKWEAAVETGQLGTFAIASALLIVVPGVDMALVTRQAVAHGRRATFATLLGFLTGGLTHTALAAVGLSAVLTASATAYTVVKLVGAAYLVAIGAQTLWATRHRIDDEERLVAGSAAGPTRRPMAWRRAYLLGLTSNVTNPKVAVFFLTFLPQFVPPGADVAAQTALLGLLFNAMASSWWVAYVLALGRISAWLDRPAVRRTIERATGVVLVALGVRLAVQR
jgi:threonine/homoserine/homoserine lactone efflux protein